MGNRVLSVTSAGDLTAAGTVLSGAEFSNGNLGATPTIAWDSGQNQVGTLTANATVALTAPTGTGAGKLLIRLVQDGTGGWSVSWPGTVRWPGGTAPVITTTAGAISIVVFYWNGTNYYGSASLNFL